MEKKCEQFLIPDGCGGWKRPNEKNQKASYSNGTVNADHIEQRYEQLEQVAKKMLSWCDQVMTHYSGDGGTPEDVSAFRDKLKALGVEV